MCGRHSWTLVPELLARTIRTQTHFDSSAGLNPEGPVTEQLTTPNWVPELGPVQTGASRLRGFPSCLCALLLVLV